MKKVLFFAASLLLVTACNKVNKEQVGNETSSEQYVNEGRTCEEDCEHNGDCYEHRGNDCVIRDNCNDDCDRHDNCNTHDNCDTRHGRHHGTNSDCNDNRHSSRHCNDRC